MEIKSLVFRRKPEDLRRKIEGGEEKLEKKEDKGGWRRKTLIVRKARNWEERFDAHAYLEEVAGNNKWYLECSRNASTYWLNFEEEEDRDKVWKKRYDIDGEGKIWIDECLTEEERKERNLLYDEAKHLHRKLEKKLGKGKVDFKKDSQRVRINFIWYIWKRGKGLEEVEIEDRDEEERKKNGKSEQSEQRSEEESD